MSKSEGHTMKRFQIVNITGEGTDESPTRMKFLTQDGQGFTRNEEKSGEWKTKNGIIKTLQRSLRKDEITHVRKYTIENGFELVSIR